MAPSSFSAASNVNYYIGHSKVSGSGSGGFAQAIKCVLFLKTTPIIF